MYHLLECRKTLSLLWPIEHGRSGTVLVSGSRHQGTGRLHPLDSHHAVRNLRGVCKCRFDYYSAMVRPAVQETTTFGKKNSLLLTILKRKGHIIQFRATQGFTRVGQEAEGVMEKYDKVMECLL